ncbi:MAG: type IV pilus modification PilV family protein [Candidatus Rifleibacteriota bacterium]
MMCNRGFSLIEILISLLVLSGAIATMFSGFDTSSQLNLYSAFESEAAFIAEREIELLKADLLSQQRKPGPAAAPSRFRNRPGVKVNTAWTGRDPEGTVRMVCTVSQSDRIFKIESFLYLPQEPGS